MSAEKTDRSIDEIQTDIDRMTKLVEQSKTTKATSEGAVATYLKQLKEEYGLDSIEEARIYIAGSKTEIATRRAETNGKVEKLKSDFETASQ